MTRISSYDFLACDKCGQIHLKANYASISKHIPADALMSNSDIRTCFSCGDMKTLDKFVYIKTEPKPARINNDFYLYTIKKLFLKALKLEIPKQDFRTQYPLI